MTEFYTNVLTLGDNILVRGYRGGIPFREKVEFFPTLYVPSKSGSTKWKTLYDEPVEEIKPGSISETRDFVKRYDGVSGFNIYGNTNSVQQYISDNYRKDVPFDMDLIRVSSIDIETETENGFPDVRKVDEEITLITIVNKNTKKIVTFGNKPWGFEVPENVTYVTCVNETQLLREFLLFWQSDYPDAVTGWNINGFDIPYLVNRITRVLGDNYAKKLSPWNKLRERTFFNNGNEEIAFSINGVAILDYLELYKKFATSIQPSYKLDAIAFAELGERKRENPGKDFKDFYTNFWDDFVDYNIHDAVLVDRLEDKMRLLELIMTMGYQAKINFEDVFSPVGMWDAIFYNHLRDKNIAIPQKKPTTNKTEKYEGAYVKDPVVGFHKWIVSFDLNSLYPHLMMQYNLSPETLTQVKFDVNVDQLLDKRMDSEISEYIRDNNLSLSANGWCYRKDKKGFLPELMEKMYSSRSSFKKQMLKIEQEYEQTKNKELLKEISRLNNLQMALKLALNSAYGAVGNNYFRYFDLRIAEGVTISGQLSIRWMSNKLNDYMNKVLKTTNVQYVIYCDTDSIYMTLDGIINQTCADKTDDEKIRYMDKVCDEILQPFINKGYKELSDYMNAYDQKMIMKRESLADKGIFIAKKRYILNVHNSEGVQYAEPKLKVMGLEMVRSSTPAIIKDKLKDSIKVILNGDESKLHEYIKSFRSEFMNLSVEDIAKPSGVNGMLTYSGSPIYVKGTPIHVRGALLFNHHVKRLKLDKKYAQIRDGDKIKFVYVEKPNPFHEDVIAFTDELPPEFDLKRFIDYDKQFEKVFLDAISIIIEPIGWNLEQTSTLDEFF